MNNKNCWEKTRKFQLIFISIFHIYSFFRISEETNAVKRRRAEFGGSNEENAVTKYKCPLTILNHTSSNTIQLHAVNHNPTTDIHTLNTNCFIKLCIIIHFKFSWALFFYKKKDLVFVSRRKLLHVVIQERI